MENNLSNTKLAFIGCGVMAESIVAGLLRKKLVGPAQSSRATRAKTAGGN
jgi:pyrroline-5-carboxylate reductase